MRPCIEKYDMKGVSEVVGALILILVVVTAGTALAIFVSERQEKIQEQERLNDRRELEEMTVISIVPDYASSDLNTLEFIVSSLHTENSFVSKINVNDAAIRQCYRFNESSELYDIPVSFLGSVKFTSLQQIKFRVSLNPAHFNFFNSPPTIAESDFIKIDVFTELANQFSRTFMPPASLIFIDVQSQYDPSIAGYSDMVILDGSLSDQPSEDAYIISWEWKILGDDNSDGTFGDPAGPEENFTLTGRKVRVDTSFTAPAGTDHEIALRVTDNYGMTSSSKLVYAY